MRDQVVEGEDVLRPVNLVLGDSGAELFVVSLEQVPVSLEKVLGRLRGHGSVSQGPAADLGPVEDFCQLTFVLEYYNG